MTDTLQGVEGVSKAQLFQQLDRATDRQGWTVHYSTHKGERENVLMFGETKKEVREEFNRLTHQTDRPDEKAPAIVSITQR